MRWVSYICCLLCLYALTTQIAHATVRHDPTLRPNKMFVTPAELQKKYPINMVIVGAERKILKIGDKSYTIGSKLGDLQIVDIQIDRVLLRDGRHGYVTLVVKH